MACSERTWWRSRSEKSGQHRSPRVPGGWRPRSIGQSRIGFGRRSYENCGFVTRPSSGDTMLKLYGFPLSNYYNRVKIVLLEKNVPFEEVLAVPGKDESIKVHSPARKIP
ncbi:MAG TPA: glutathione S-transferase N-terminal domain-containing protein, partial [Burkholderiales bacterium]